MICSFFTSHERLVCEDICQGQEDICIPVTNLFDDSRIEPAGKSTILFIV